MSRLLGTVAGWVLGLFEKLESRYPNVDYFSAVGGVVGAAVVLREALLSEDTFWIAGAVVLTVSMVLGAVANAARAANLKSLDRRLLEEYIDGLDDAYDQWRRTASIQAGSIGLASKIAGRLTPQDAEEIIGQCLNSISATMRDLFSFERDEVCVNVAVPNNAGDMLTIAKMNIYRDGRRKGRVLPYDAAGPEPGAARVYDTGEEFYMEKTEDYPGLFDPHRQRYRCILSWPVFASDQERPLAVINIDALQPSAFGTDEEGDKQARALARTVCGPATSIIAFALCDKRVFAAERKAVRQPL